MDATATDTLADMLALYDEHRIQCLPLEPKTKKCYVDNWVEREFAPEDFKSDSNSGIKLGGKSDGVMDIDLDWPEAVQIAHYYLPPTQFVFGRDSKPASHLLYRSTDKTTTIKFQVPGGGVILELRGDGCQTMAPPSIHPSGEKVRFWANEEITPYSHAVLKRACGQAAAACVIYRNMVDGGRHDLAIAVIGTLLRARWEVQMVQDFLTPILTHGAKDKSAQDTILREVQKLADKLKSDQGRVPGYKRLRQVLGESADYVLEWLGISKRDQIGTDEIEPFPLALAPTLAEFVAMDWPKPEPLIEGILNRDESAVSAGHRGVGKTQLTLSRCRAMALGEAWIKPEWVVPRPLRVLYVDGEMPAAQLVQRAQAWFGGAFPDTFRIIPSALFRKLLGGKFLLHDVIHQRRFIALLEELEAGGWRPDYITFDNLSSMSFGIEENSNTDFDSIRAFFEELRHLGYAHELIVHTGKNGDQRGASRKLDNPDVSVKLIDLKERSSDPAKLRVEFDKFRNGVAPDEFEIELVTREDGLLEWAIVGGQGQGRNPTWVAVLEKLWEKKPRTQTALADMLRVKPPTIHGHIAKLRSKGFVEADGLGVTGDGLQFLQQRHGVENSDF